MQREKKNITKTGSYVFGDNYKLIFRNAFNVSLSECNITCGSNCEIICGSNCEIICRNNCEIVCSWKCIINCGNDCLINCKTFSLIKANEGSKLLFNNKIFKKNEKNIWWLLDFFNLINTYEDIVWQTKNPDKYKELYFVTDELNSAKLF